MKIDTHFLTVEGENLAEINDLITIYFDKLHKHNTVADEDDDAPKRAYTSREPRAPSVPVETEEERYKRAYKAKFNLRYRHMTDGPKLDALRLAVSSEELEKFAPPIVASEETVGAGDAEQPSEPVAPVVTDDDGGDTL